MERKIGEIFEYNGEWYQCVAATLGCKGCSFCTQDDCTRYQCLSRVRSDKTSVIFKKLEKVGESYEAFGKLFQPYKLSENIPIPVWDVNYFMCPHWKEGIVDIEVKQNKEDMIEQHSTENYPTKEEKIAERIANKIANKVSEDIQNQFEKNMNKLKLKPFSLEAAKAGKPVCTRDGRKARIICFDAKGMHQPIIALITQDNGIEYIETYYSDGRFNDDSNSQSDYDLMMLPEKKEGWINIYRAGEINCKPGMTVFATKELAEKYKYDDGPYVDTIKIEWEE